jgi:SAM-dependent methyltransferase
MSRLALAAWRAQPPRVSASRGRVTACDLSPAMLAVATAKPGLDGAGPITYIECPADALEVADGAFDVAVCQQGLQFLPRPASGAQRDAAPLKPGARVGASAWCGIEQYPPFEALSHERRLGPVCRGCSSRFACRQPD